MLDYFTVQTSSINPGLITVLFSSILAFVLSMLIAFTYERTFRGLSYYHNFVQSLVLSSIVASTIMQAIGDSLARGLGMIGALAIVRFRTNFKDSRDIIFMFAALAAGIGCGVNAYTVAVIGTVAFCTASAALHFIPSIRTNAFDGIVRFNVEDEPRVKQSIETVLRAYCRQFVLVTVREASQGKRIEYAYQIKLKNTNNSAELAHALQKIDTLKSINLINQTLTAEV